MKQQTQDYLEASDRHRQVAVLLRGWQIADAWPEWAVTADFYSAVHCVNAYLWEMYDFEPQSHAERTLAVQRDVTLVTIAAPYNQLRNWSHSARYRPTFRASEALVQRAFEYLEQIRSLVLSQIT